jgi:hypothetical protein
MVLSNAERQRRFRERHAELKRRYVTGAGIDSKEIRVLLKEIKRKRKEAKAARENKVWNPEAIIKLELIDLIDWIEGELKRILDSVT